MSTVTSTKFPYDPTMDDREAALRLLGETFKPNYVPKGGNVVGQLVVQEPQDQPMFSEEFMAMVHDHAYETLRSYLERSKQDVAVKLLDDLMILSMRNTGSAAQVMKNMMIGEAIGQASQHVLALGGNWGN